ncbi:hypothetical protein [Bacillus bombysepticus]|uniref:hypothetical protein n=1 Tax=Bacillus bombysepticus TaxID=658666 RepID=UPI00301B17B7
MNKIKMKFEAECDNCLADISTYPLNTYGDWLQTILRYHKHCDIRTIDRTIRSDEIYYCTSRLEFELGVVQTEWMVWYGEPFLCAVTLTEQSPKLIYSGDMILCFQKERDEVLGDALPWNTWGMNLKEMYHHMKKCLS